MLLAPVSNYLPRPLPPPAAPRSLVSSVTNIVSFLSGHTSFLLFFSGEEFLLGGAIFFHRIWTLLKGFFGHGPFLGLPFQKSLQNFFFTKPFRAACTPIQSVSLQRNSQLIAWPKGVGCYFSRPAPFLRYFFRPPSPPYFGQIHVVSPFL